MASSSREEATHPNINPLLLASARRGSWEALQYLFNRQDEHHRPMMIPTQELLGFLTIQVPASPDIEEGIVHVPAPFAVGDLLQGVTPDGDNALHAVAGNGDDEDFKNCANMIYARNRDLLFSKNHNGDTPLHSAARAGNFNMVSHLIDLAGPGAGGERPDWRLTLLRMQNKHHETALHEAVRLEDGTILDSKDREVLVDAHGAPEEARITLFVAQQATNIVKLLMGADPELANYPADGISPLYLAILLEKSTIALTLYCMSNGNLSYSGADGQNALHVALLRDEVMVGFLLHWKKSLTAQVDKDGSTPLHFICFSSWSIWAFQQVFIRNPAALYHADKNGFFPIHVAASVGGEGIIDFLVQVCPDSAGLRDAKGKTFLHVAIEKGRLDIVSYVCNNPSLAWILNMRDNNGNTALHTAIQAKKLRFFCALLGNLKVNLILTNNQGETPRDVSKSKLPPDGLWYIGSHDIQIDHALQLVGANHGALRLDMYREKYDRPNNPEDYQKESDRLKDATQRFIVASVLIATMAFSAAFAIPGGYRADDHTKGGTPTLAGGYIFDAFIVATALAFVCSLLATTGFMIAGVPMGNLITRRHYFMMSDFYFFSSVTAMSITFALGVYIVLAPVARNTAIAICVIAPAVVVARDTRLFLDRLIIARPVWIRKGPVEILRLVRDNLFARLWPFLVSFGWAAFARIQWRQIPDQPIGVLIIICMGCTMVLIFVCAAAWRRLRVFCR